MPSGEYTRALGASNRSRTTAREPLSRMGGGKCPVKWCTRCCSALLSAPQKRVEPICCHADRRPFSVPNNNRATSSYRKRPGPHEAPSRVVSSTTNRDGARHTRRWASAHDTRARHRKQPAHTPDARSAQGLSPRSSALESAYGAATRPISAPASAETMAPTRTPTRTLTPDPARPPHARPANLPRRCPRPDLRPDRPQTCRLPCLRRRLTA